MLRNLTNDIKLSDELDAFIKNTTERFNEPWLIWGTNEKKGQQYFYYDESSKNIYKSVWKYDKHQFIEIFVCLKGICAMRIGNRIYNIREGNVCFISFNEPHVEMTSDDKEYLGIWLQINLGNIKVHVSGNNKHSFFMAKKHFIALEHVYNFLTTVINADASNDTIYQEELIKACVIQLLAIVLRNIRNNQIKELDYQKWKEVTVTEIKDFIKLNYKKRLKLKDISHEICVSPNYLNNIFKEVTGKTIMQYLKDYKIKMACDLLRNTSKTLKVIADELGYYDQYHFSKVFKNHMGYSPMQYKKIKSGPKKDA